MTDARLLRVRFAWPPALEARRVREALASTLDRPLATSWTVGRGTTDAAGCAWWRDDMPALPDADRVRRALERVTDDVEVALLRVLLDIRGAAAGKPAPFRYAVETDVAPEHEADFNAWYDREHLAGLASVPGTVHAARFRDDDGHPRYLALYDLEREDVLGSPRWLAVRATAWSSRVRPAFRNTRRTLYTPI